MIEHLRNKIGWYILALVVLCIYFGHIDPDPEYPVFIFYLMIPVVFWKLPPFGWSDRVFGWAASKDPLGTKRATKRFMDKRGNKWYWWLAYLVVIWIIASVIYSLIAGEPTLVIVG